MCANWGYYDAFLFLEQHGLSDEHSFQYMTVQNHMQHDLAFPLSPPHRAPDHLQITSTRSLHLFLSPGRKLGKYSTTDTCRFWSWYYILWYTRCLLTNPILHCRLNSPSEKKVSKLSREKIKTLPFFVKINLNKLIVFKFSNYIQFLWVSVTISNFHFIVQDELLFAIVK